MKRLASWSRYLKPYLPPANAENLRAIFPGAETRAEQPRSAIRSVRRLHESGARVLAETDAPNPGTAFGVSVHGELALLVGAGLTPTEALAAATAATADAFRMHDRGRIAPGLRADLLLVEGDPTRDIEVTRRIRRVWRGGHPIARPPVEDGGAPGAEASHEIPANGWISRFDDRTATLGQGWMESTDRIAGGSSTVGFDVVDDDLGEGGHLRIAGEVAPGLPFGQAGVMLVPGVRPMAPVDLSDWSGIAFRAAGGTVRAADRRRPVDRRLRSWARGLRSGSSSPSGNSIRACRGRSMGGPGGLPSAAGSLRGG